jgi:hypothetical protein
VREGACGKRPAVTTAPHPQAYLTDLLKGSPQLAPYRPEVGIDPKLSDAELVTLAVMQALLGLTSEARWLRYARAHCGTCSPTCPSSPATTSGCVTRRC